MNKKRHSFEPTCRTVMIFWRTIAALFELSGKLCLVSVLLAITKLWPRTDSHPAQNQLQLTAQIIEQSTIRLRRSYLTLLTLTTNPIPSGPNPTSPNPNTLNLLTVTLINPNPKKDRSQIKQNSPLFYWPKLNIISRHNTYSSFGITQVEKV